MAKLLTGTRIYGTATVDTQLFVSGTTSASATNTGALQVVGGIGVGGGGYFGGVVTATNFILNGYQVSTSTSGGSAGGVTVSSTITNASFYPVFVSVNTTTPTALPEFTTSSFTINPGSGLVGHVLTSAGGTSELLR